MPQECFSLHIDREQQKSHVGDSTKKLPKDLTIPICLWLGHFREFETRSNEAWRHHVFVQADSMCPPLGLGLGLGLGKGLNFFNLKNL